jgi:hypothetical protein
MFCSKLASYEDLLWRVELLPPDVGEGFRLELDWLIVPS